MSRITIPKFHMITVLMDYIKKYYLLKRVLYPVFKSFVIKFSVVLHPELVEGCINYLINYIKYSGLINDVRKKLGPDWEKDITRSIIINTCFALNLVKSEDPIERSFNLEKYIRNNNFKFWYSVHHLFDIVFSENTFLLNGFGFLRLDISVRDVENEYLDKYEWLEDYKSQSIPYLDYDSFNTLTVLSTLLPGFVFETYNIGFKKEMPCIGDFIWNQKADYASVLKSDGVTDLTICYNIALGVTLLTPGKNDIDITTSSLETLYYGFDEVKVNHYENLTYFVMTGVEFELPRGNSREGDGDPFGGRPNKGPSDGQDPSGSTPNNSNNPGPSGPNDSSNPKKGKGKSRKSGPFDEPSGKTELKSHPIILTDEELNSEVITIRNSLERNIRYLVNKGIDVSKDLAISYIKAKLLSDQIPRVVNNYGFGSNLSVNPTAQISLIPGLNRVPRIRG